MESFLSDLVRIPSENPPAAHYGDCVDRIERELLDLALPSRRLINEHVVEAGFGAGDRELYFSGHYDVVPAQAREQFEPRVQGDLLFGRGSSDMKGGLVAMTYAVAALAASDAAIDGRVVLRFVPDEETGGRNGSALLVSAGAISPRSVGMLTPEPTGGVIWHASRGAVTWKVTTHGRPAHVGLHYRGVSAFDGMLEVVRELKSLAADVTPRRTSSRTADDAARNSILLLGGRIEGGDNFNVVPGWCSMTVDRRTNPEESLAAERRRLTECIDRVRARGVDVSIEVIQEGDASYTPTDGELATALTSAITKIGGSTVPFELCPGLLETRFYAAAGIPALAYGPGDLAVSHGPDEHIDLTRMIEVSAIYAATALAMLSRD